MKKKFVLGFLTGLAVALLVFVPAGCAKKDQALPEEQEASPEAEEPSPEPAAEIIYTRADPGKWAGKEDAHVPRIAYEKTETGLRVTIAVDHVMNPETPHYIEWIKLEDGEGNVLGKREFKPENEKPEAVFELDTVPARLKAWEHCNLHGTWLEETEVTDQQSQ